ncbi:hypothetical protein Tco_1310535 [Tanacetum coccineum]
MLQAREDLMESIETFLKKFNRISFRETPKVLNEELAEFINSPSWNRPAVYNDDDEDYTIAITPNLATEEPVNSLTSKDHSEIVVDFNDDSTSSDDDSFSIDNIKYVEASPPNSEPVSLEVVEVVIPEVGEIDDDILLTIKDDILKEKLSNVSLLFAKIEAIKYNHTPSSDLMTKSSSTSLNLFLKETNTFDNSLPESETFCFNLEEISSEKRLVLASSKSTLPHSDFSLSKYDSFIFDLLINPFPPADRSDFYHEEFAAELAHIISHPEYDCFCFKNEPELGDFTIDVVGDIYPIREPRVHVLNVLPTHPTLQLDLDFILSSDSLFAYVVWIFLPFLTYPVTPPYLHSSGNKDTIFDPEISIYHSFFTGVYLIGS